MLTFFRLIYRMVHLTEINVSCYTATIQAIYRTSTPRSDCRDIIFVCSAAT